MTHLLVVFLSNLRHVACNLAIRYLYFNVHLRQKDFDDYSGGESYVFSKTLELVRDTNTHTPLRDVDTDLELKRPLPQIDLLWFPQKVNYIFG